MRFLIDECMPSIVSNILEEDGYDILDIATSIYRGAQDIQLVEIAIRENRVILTKDKGYSLVMFQKKLPGLWIFRVPDIFKSKNTGILLNKFLKNVEVKELIGKLVILSPGKTRIRSIT